MNFEFHNIFNYLIRKNQFQDASERARLSDQFMVFSQFVYLQVLVEELKEFVDVLQVQKSDRN